MKLDSISNNIGCVWRDILSNFINVSFMGCVWPSPICPWPLPWSPHFHRQDNALLKLCLSLKPPRSAGAATQTKATKHRWLWRCHPASLSHLKPCFHVLRIAPSSDTNFDQAPPDSASLKNKPTKSWRYTPISINFRWSCLNHLTYWHHIASGRPPCCQIWVISLQSYCH